MKNQIKNLRTIIVLVLFLLLLLFLFTRNTYSNTHIISAGGMLFTPPTVTATVGDTIKWVWSNGIHTTTSVTIPVGAAPWSSPLDSVHLTFIYVITIAGQYNFHCNYHYIFGMNGVINASPTAIKPISGEAPEKFILYQNYPNPFNPTTNIKFDIAKNAVVKLIIYDITGGLVETLVKEELRPGSYSVDWDASRYSSGVYFYKLEIPGFSETKKLMIVK